MMQAERRHPMAGLLGQWVGGLALVFTLVNIHMAPWPGHMGEKFYGLPFLLDLLGKESAQPVWGVKHAYSAQDWALLLLSVSSFLVAWWGTRTRPEINVPDAQDEASMRQAMEGATTKVTGTSGVVNPTTASIVAGIVGEIAAENEAVVSGALGALSKGEFGAQAAKAVVDRPMIDGMVKLDASEVIPLPVDNEDQGEQATSSQPGSVPLPGISEIDAEDIDIDIIPDEKVVSGDMDVFSSSTKPGILPEAIIDDTINLPPKPPVLPQLPDLDEPAVSKPSPVIAKSMPSLPALPSLPSLGD